MKKILPIAGISLVLDQIIKVIVITNMSLYDSVSVINNFFNITYVRNTGAAWSILSGNTMLLSVISLVALVLIYFYCIKDKKLTKFETLSYGLLIGGTFGNLVDRIFYGYVIDYLDFKIFSYNFPVFNLADICIVIGVILICISLIGGELDDRTKNQ